MTPVFVSGSRRFAEALLAFAASVALVAAAHAEEAPPATTTNADAARPADAKPAEKKPAESKPAAKKPAEKKPAEKKADEKKADEKIPHDPPGAGTIPPAEVPGEVKPVEPPRGSSPTRPTAPAKPAKPAREAKEAKPTADAAPADGTTAAPATAADAAKPAATPAATADAAKPAAAPADAAKPAATPAPTADAKPASTPGGSSGDAEAVWNAYEKRWSETDDYSAGFRQTIEVPDVGSRVESAGRFYFMKPGLVRWEYTEGPPQTVVGDGTWIWLYQPDLEQVYKIPYAKAFGRGGLVELLAGREGVSERYTAKLEKPDAASVRILLKSLQEGAGDLEVTLEADSFDIREVVVHDAAGSTTRMTFAEPRRNKGSDKTRFTFTPPEGVDIIADSEAGF